MKRTIAALAIAGTALAALPALAVNASLVDSHWTQANAGSTATIDHSVWDGILAKYVKPGADGVARFDYGGVSPADKSALKAYIRSLEDIAPTAHNRDVQMAYWFNMYNAVTIDLVLDAYPVSSIKKVKGGLFNTGPWKADVVTVEGRALSLDNIEHGILRPIWNDPRVHYGVNCASIGCPDLPTDAFTAANLQGMLDAGARAYVNHPRGVTVEGDRAVVSSIYDWFIADFGGNDAGVLEHLRQYAAGPTASALQGVTRVGGDRYDWTLNDVN